MAGDAPRTIGESSGAELVFALGHELGNLVGAIRLHAHLIGADMGPRELAQVSLDIDHLSARCAALLAHVRPLLSGPPAQVEEVAPAELLHGLESVMREHGVRGAELEFEADEQALPALSVDREVLQHLLQSLLFVALENASPKGAVRVRARRHGGDGNAVAIEIEDDGEVDEDPAAWREQTKRGRPLILAIAQDVLGKRGGTLDVDHAQGHTRVRLELPGR